MGDTDGNDMQDERGYDKSAVQLAGLDLEVH